MRRQRKQTQRPRTEAAAGLPVQKRSGPRSNGAAALQQQQQGQAETEQALRAECTRRGRTRAATAAPGNSVATTDREELQGQDERLANQEREVSKGSDSTFHAVRNRGDIHKLCSLLRDVMPASGNLLEGRYTVTTMREALTQLAGSGAPQLREQVHGCRGLRPPRPPRCPRLDGLHLTRCTMPTPLHRRAGLTTYPGCWPGGLAMAAAALSSSAPCSSSPRASTVGSWRPSVRVAAGHAVLGCIWARRAGVGKGRVQEADACMPPPPFPPGAYAKRWPVPLTLADVRHANAEGREEHERKAVARQRGGSGSSWAKRAMKCKPVPAVAEPAAASGASRVTRAASRQQQAPQLQQVAEPRQTRGAKTASEQGQPQGPGNAAATARSCEGCRPAAAGALPRAAAAPEAASPGQLPAPAATGELAAPPADSGAAPKVGTGWHAAGDGWWALQALPYTVKHKALSVGSASLLLRRLLPHGAGPPPRAAPPPPLPTTRPPYASPVQTLPPALLPVLRLPARRRAGQGFWQEPAAGTAGAVVARRGARRGL